jgi:tRNA (cmo5U34)-methyltransferase
VLRLALREACLPRTLPRTPEPTAEMASPDSVVGFHDEGASSLLPIYHFNALAINALVPNGGRIVDLGCGTGQFLAYLASHRPDLEIIGLDTSEEMVRFGSQQLSRTGLDRRVRLMHGDMREFRKIITSGADLVSSIFSLHHLTTSADLVSCIQEITAIMVRQSTRLWIFDHARPRRPPTAREVPEIFTPGASAAFRRDSYNSLCASWSFEELKAVLRDFIPGPIRASISRLLPFYQMHWTPTAKSGQCSSWLEDGYLPRRAQADARILAIILRLHRIVNQGP